MKVNKTVLSDATSRLPLGQSLVETAVFLPIILILLAGVIEVSNLLVTQNRVTTAARIGTGFGATNYIDDGDPSDTFEAMSTVALNNVEDTLDLQEDRWDIYTVKATLNSDATDFDEWVWERPYGTQQVFPESQWTANEEQIKTDIREALGESDGGIEIVATVSYHHRHSLLGLDFFNVGPLTQVRGLTVMRVSQTSGDYAGCDLFPIALRVENISLYPENFVGTMVEDGERFISSEWEVNQAHIVPNHAYDDGPPSDHSGFPLAAGGHRLNVPREDPIAVKRGDIFEAREADGPGNFGWLTWTGATDSPTLATNLTPPGTLTLQKPPPEGKVNYVNPDDPDDWIPNKGDWVQGSTGNMNSNAVLTQFDSHVDDERPVQILVYDQKRGTGSNFDYRIYDFALVYLRGRITAGNDKRILVEFIQWAEPCFLPES